MLNINTKLFLGNVTYHLWLIRVSLTASHVQLIRFCEHLILYPLQRLVISSISK